MYTSTRSEVKVSASKAILDGLVPDGGLYVFDFLDNNFFNNSLIGKTYNEIAKEIYKIFLDDYSEEEIDYIINQSYNQEKFILEPAVLKSFDKLSFLELFHGETFAFKDIALSALPYMLEVAKKIQKVKKRSVILTATSGDTGSATLSGFKNAIDAFVIVLYPKNGISEFQEKQMQSLQNKNTLLIPIEGNFDDCQKIVKDVLKTIKLNNIGITSANSINIGRIISQVVYYFYAYLDLVEKNVIHFKDLINISVPTGNFGNVYAGYIAKKLGLPINKLIIGSNDNRVLNDIFRHHIYNIDREFYKTLSPSMDILVSSNFERYLYDITKNQDIVKNYMNDLSQNQYIKIKELNNREEFYSSTCNDEETIKMINAVKTQFNYLIDPHTAVAYKAFLDYVSENKDDKYHTLIVSTASPNKFSETVMKSINPNHINSLDYNISYIQTVAPYLFDTRVNSILKENIDSSIYTLDEAKQKIKKVLGELDANN